MRKLLLCLGGAGLVWAISGSPWAIAVLVGTCLLAFLLARRLANAPNARWAVQTGRLAVPAALLSLVLLNVTGLIGTLTGTPSPASGPSSSALIAMPFYLLGAAAFVTDVALRRLPMPSVLDFAVYMMLPFKLLSGPLELPRLLQQIQQRSLRIRWLTMLAGWPWIALGAFMKFVIANRLEPGRLLVHTDPLTSFLAAGVFELKFYFDFAGYSFLAHGAALAVGLRINHNFNHPFFASNVVLFWRSWHMSLGRFLTRYVLEPNLGMWRTHGQKMVFASSIFLVSAMWHGGTLNYLLWGLFHGLCYYGYGRWLKRRRLPAALGVMAMLLFFVFGRMLAIDADGLRLLTRLGSFFLPAEYATGVSACGVFDCLWGSEIRALALAAVFFIAEAVSQHLYPKRRGYHLMRRPWAAMLLSVGFVVFGIGSGTLLYARI